MRPHSPGGATYRPRPRIDSALVKALARAHRWQRLLESGECTSITELAAAEKINRSYMCRVLRPTLLALEIVEAIVDGRQPEGVTRPMLMKGFPVESGRSTWRIWQRRINAAHLHRCRQ